LPNFKQINFEAKRACCCLNLADLRGNIGIIRIGQDLAGKRIELLREVVPGGTLQGQSFRFANFNSFLFF